MGNLCTWILRIEVRDVDRNEGPTSQLFLDRAPESLNEFVVVVDNQTRVVTEISKQPRREATRSA